MLFIGYLPPDFSTRAVDGDAFFNDLSKKVYEYQSEGEIIICGDFNARLCSESDYIEGVDVVNQGWLLIQQLIAIVTFY